MPSRSAFTCCMYHQRAQPLVGVGRVEQRLAARRFPRVGARISDLGKVHARGTLTLKVTAEPLVDGHGRRISDLRVSVTDRCNFRCQYCMPAEGLPWLDRAEMLSFEEIERLVRVFGGWA